MKWHVNFWVFKFLQKTEYIEFLEKDQLGLNMNQVKGDSDGLEEKEKKEDILLKNNKSGISEMRIGLCPSFD